MFADSMLGTSWVELSRRGWTTLTSFGVQAVLVGLLLILPILRTVRLPEARTVSTPVTVGRIGRQPTAAQPRRGAAGHIPNEIVLARPMLPSHTPAAVARSDVASFDGPPGGLNFGSEPGILPGSPNEFPFPAMSGTHAVMPRPPVPIVTHTFRPSSMLEGSLIRRVLPVYPPPARNARIQGAVVLFAIISKAGTIENLRVLSGHPMLVPAAMEAVRQWRYRPCILNHEPIEVETRITVNFTLGNGE